MTRTGRSPNLPRHAGNELEHVALALYCSDLAMDPADVDIAEISRPEWTNYLEWASTAIAAFDAITAFRASRS